ncbi:MAG: carbohydrate kinase family protein [Christensenellales bacterium]|jgi:sugar/nucleoside kinase (ribokinase family)
MKGAIVTAGYATVDIIKTIETFPDRHGLVRILGTQRALGGAACNCALDLARLAPALTVKPLAVVGEDEYGAAVFDAFGKCKNIDTSLMVRAGSTAFTDVLDEADTRVRTFLVYRGANELFDVDTVDVETLDCDIFHIGYICLLPALDQLDPEYGTRMARLLRKVQRAGILTSVDAVFDSSGRHKTLIPAAMRYTDILSVNEHEAGAACGIALRGADDALLEDRIPEVLRQFRAWGVKKWAVIHAPECAWGIDESGAVMRVPGAKLPEGFIKGSVGSGDAFVSGLLLGAHAARPLADAMEDGIAAAVTSLTAPGASDGIRPLDQARALLKTLERG